MCGGKYDMDCVANLMETKTVKQFEHSPVFIKVMNECIVAQFFESQCMMKYTAHKCTIRSVVSKHFEIVIKIH